MKVIASVNDFMFRHKVGASVVSVRRSGGSDTFDALNHYINVYVNIFIKIVTILIAK